jgi:hypothetical protein
MPGKEAVHGGWYPFETTFEGDKVKMFLGDLRPGQAEIIKPYMRQYGDLDEAGRQGLELIEKVRPILRETVMDITGVTVNGAPVTPEDLCTCVALTTLCWDVIFELFLRSTGSCPRCHARTRIGGPAGQTCFRCGHRFTKSIKPLPVLDAPARDQ